MFWLYRSPIAARGGYFTNSNDFYLHVIAVAGLKERGGGVGTLWEQPVFHGSILLFYTTYTYIARRAIPADELPVDDITFHFEISNINAIQLLGPSI